MKTKYQCSGGMVTREDSKKWRVNSPDGRNVGTFRTRKAALQKAEHWDKWDAFDSLVDIGFTLYPFSFLLASKTLMSIGKGELFIPSDEQMEAAITLDCLLWFLACNPELAEKLLKEKRE